MTNAIAIGLVLLVVCFVGYDLSTDGGRIVFLGRQFTDLVRYIAFWR